MADKPFGIEELNFYGDTSIPQIQSADHLFLRVGSDKTVQIGDDNSHFTAIGPGLVKINGALNVTGDITAFYSSSDKKLKDNIKPIEDPLAKVISISGNTFNWNGQSEFEGQYDTGVVAQEIESLGLPGIVKEQVSGHKSVQYHKLVPLLIEAIKELEARVTLLEK